MNKRLTSNKTSTFQILLRVFAIGFIIALIAGIGFLTINFLINKDENKKINALFKTVTPFPNSAVQKNEIEDFPIVIRRYFNYIQLIGSEVVYSVRSKHSGFIVKPNSNDTIRFNSKQYYRGDAPSYLWISDFGLTITQDSYYNGKVFREVKFLDFILLDVTDGKKLNQAALLNYFSEIIWFPSAYMNNGILWDATGENAFKGVIEQDGIEVTAHFEIDELGALKRFTANSCMEVKGIGIPLTCSLEVSDYREFGGYKIPYKVTSVLTLSNGDYQFMNLELQEIEYNIEEPF